MYQGLLLAVLSLITQTFNGFCQTVCKEERCSSTPDVCFPTVNKCDYFPDCPFGDDENFLVCPEYPLGCRGGFQRLKEFCIQSTNKLLSWEDSKQECKSRGAHLIEAVTLEAISTLLSYVRDVLKHDVWLGLTDKVEKGKFVWNYSRTNFDVSLSKIFAGNKIPNNRGSDCVKTTKGNSYRWNVLTCLAKYDAVCQQIADTADFQFTGYTYTEVDVVRAEPGAFLQIIYGSLKIHTGVEQTDIYKEMDVWVGSGRNSYNLVCTVNLVSKISTAPCHLTSSNPANLVYKFSLSLPVRFSQSGQELWVMVNPNVRKTEKLERNRHVKFNYTIGRLPTYYRILVKIGLERYTVKDSAITKVITNSDKPDLLICYETKAIGKDKLNFTSLLREIVRETTHELKKGIQRFCHSYPSISLPVQVRVATTLSKYPTITNWDVFEVAVDDPVSDLARTVLVYMIPVFILTTLGSFVVSFYYMRLWNYLSTPGDKREKDRPRMFIWF